MIGAINIGNTNTAFAIGSSNEFKHFLLPTLEYNDVQSFLNLLSQYEFPETLESCVVASVQPLKTPIVQEAIQQRFDCTVTLLTHDSDFGFDFSSYPPYSLGLDRIVAMMAAVQKYGSTVTVCDLGTATTYNVVYQGVFKGGSILPGLRLGLQVLGEKTGLLPHIEIESYPSYLGLNTEDSLLSGALFGTLDVLNGYQQRIQKDFPNMIFVMTGGNAKNIINYSHPTWHYEPNLILEGLLAWIEKKEHLL